MFTVRSRKSFFSRFNPFGGRKQKPAPTCKARKSLRPIESRRMSVEPLEHRNLLSIDLSSLPHQCGVVPKFSTGK